jgi:tetratricopeptide (TPR) repeat protein
MRLSHVLTLLTGGAVVALVVLAARGDREVHPRSRATLDPRIDRLLSRLDRLEELLVADEAREREVATRLERLEALPVETPGPAPVAEAVRVPEEKLRLRAKGLSTDLTRAADAIEAWGEVAKHSRDPERKAEAWFEQGEVYRRLEDYRQAAASWQRVVDTVGLHSGRGQVAAYQLGWAHAHLQDRHAAYQAFRMLAATPGLSKAMESAVRLQVAGFARATGDVDTARREYRRYVDDFAEDEAEHFRSLAETAAERLRELS